MKRWVFNLCVTVAVPVVGMVMWHFAGENPKPIPQPTEVERVEIESELMEAQANAFISDGKE